QGAPGADESGSLLIERQQIWKVFISQSHIHQIAAVRRQRRMAQISEHELAVDPFGTRLVRHCLGQLHSIEGADPMRFEPAPRATGPACQVRDRFELSPGHGLDALKQRAIHRIARLHLIVGSCPGRVAFLDGKGGSVSGVAYQAQRRYAQAEPLYLQALTIYEQQVGATHPDTAATLNNLGACIRIRGSISKQSRCCGGRRSSASCGSGALTPSPRPHLAIWRSASPPWRDWTRGGSAQMRAG